MKERLQKLMAQAGIASRRASEDMIEQGRVRVNGKLAKVGDAADPDTDQIEVDGRRLRFDQEKVYIAIHKPKHVITTTERHHGDERRTIRDLVPHKGHLFTIGRLDADSEGLVVLTNDGDLAYNLSHPKFMHTKMYKVIVRGLPTEQALESWRNGVFLEEGKTAPAFVQLSRGARDLSTLKVVMTEGKKRQIRRVAALVGFPVERLLRVQIGMLEMGSLAPGQWRELTPGDVKALSTPSPELKEIRRLRRVAKGRPVKDADGPNRPADERDERPRRRVSAASVDETPKRPRRSLVPPIKTDESPDKPRRRRPDEASGDSERPRRRPAAQAGDTAETPRRRRPTTTQDEQKRPASPRPRKPGPKSQTGDTSPRKPGTSRGPKTRTPRRTNRKP